MTVLLDNPPIVISLHHPHSVFIFPDSLDEVQWSTMPVSPSTTALAHPDSKSNISQHSIPPAISTIALSSLKPHKSSSTARNTTLTHATGYDLTLHFQHHTPPSPHLESLFMEATSCRSSQPGIETLVSVFNFVKGVKYPNGLYPPYQLGVSGEEGVLSVYRSYKAEDLSFPEVSVLASSETVNEVRRRRGKGVYWSDIMFEIWKRYSASSIEDGTTRLAGLRGRRGELSKLRFVAIPEVNNEEVKAVARYAFESRGLDVEFDTLVVDREDKMAEDGSGWTLFDAFAGAASVKAIQRMTTDHGDELGGIMPGKIYIKYSRFDYPGQGEIWLPNLLVEMRKVKSGQ